MLFAYKRIYIYTGVHLRTYIVTYINDVYISNMPPCSVAHVPKKIVGTYGIMSSGNKCISLGVIITRQVYLCSCFRLL
jgi:hypothetical protein